jgi:hypothetical protein
VETTEISVDLHFGDHFVIGSLQQKIGYTSVGLDV